MRVKEALTATEAVALCLDIRTSRVVRGYLGVTAHFLDESGVLRNCVLACTRFKGKHTADNIVDHAVEVINEYGIRDKVRFVFTDNAANMLKAFRGVMPGMTETETPDEGMRVFCYHLGVLHIISLI